MEKGKGQGKLRTTAVIAGSRRNGPAGALGCIGTESYRSIPLPYLAHPRAGILGTVSIYSRLLRVARSTILMARVVEQRESGSGAGDPEKF